MSVPSDSRLEIEAMVSNRDIGFLHPGQQAEMIPSILPVTVFCTGRRSPSRRTTSSATDNRTETAASRKARN